MNSNNIKNEMSLGGIKNDISKVENKENNLIQANSQNYLKMNRTSSGRNTNNMKSMSGIRKLYTLKANSSSRRLESQSYRDLNYKHKQNDSEKNDRIIQGNSNIYHTTMNSKSKRISKGKVSSSETPKIRSHNEALLTGIRSKLKNKENMGDKENEKPNNKLKDIPHDHLRHLKKNPNSILPPKQIKSSHNLKHKPQSSSSRIEYYNKVDQVMEKKIEKSNKEEHDEIMKREKVHHQIMNHLKTGTLIENPIITPIMANDGTVRQYIINDPISNPEEVEPEIALLPSHKIANTTVDKSK